MYTISLNCNADELAAITHDKFLSLKFDGETEPQVWVKKEHVPVIMAEFFRKQIELGNIAAKEGFLVDASNINDVFTGSYLDSLSLFELAELQSKVADRMKAINNASRIKCYKLVSDDNLFESKAFCAIENATGYLKGLFMNELDDIDSDIKIQPIYLTENEVRKVCADYITDNKSFNG